MKLTIRNAHEEWRDPVEKETRRQAAKLEKLLKSYDPDLVQLHANIEKHARKESYTFTVNLSLPTGTLHATGEGSDVLASVKESFAEIYSAMQEAPGPAAQGLRVETKAPARPNSSLSLASRLALRTPNVTCGSLHSGVTLPLRLSRLRRAQAIYTIDGLYSRGVAQW